MRTCLLALLTEPEETAKETNKKINENDNVEAAAGIAGIHHAILSGSAAGLLRRHLQWRSVIRLADPEALLERLTEGYRVLRVSTRQPAGSTGRSRRARLAAEGGSKRPWL